MLFNSNIILGIRASEVKLFEYDLTMPDRQGKWYKKVSTPIYIAILKGLFLIHIDMH